MMLLSKLFSEKAFEELASIAGQIPLAIWDTIYMTLVSTLFAVIIGLPLGVLLVVGDKGGIMPLPRPIMAVLGVIINILRSVPFIILMVLVVPLTRLIVGTSLGTEAVIVQLTIAAFPFVARLVEGSLREVDPNLIEAAQSMGATPFQIIVKVMLPESVPSLVSNLTVALTTILSYGAMSGALGGGGLGKIAVDYGYYRYQDLVLVVCVILLVLLVQLIQMLGTFLSKRLDKRLKK
jgi:D-methionine transport system permease protein